MSHLKFSAFFIALLLVIVSLQTVKSQDYNSLIISNIHENVPLKTYLDQLTSASGIRFFYDDKLLNEIELKKTDNGRLFIDYLNQVLSAKGITYLIYREKNIILIDRNTLILKNQIGLTKKDESGNNYTQVDVGDPMLAGKYKKATLNGHIRSGKTGEPLTGATIFVKDQENGAVTDLKGYFKIEMPIGKHEVQFAYVGFENKELTINMISTGSLDVELFEGSINIEQVVITSNGNANIARPDMGIIRMDTKSINSVPVIMGEPDLIKTMTLMPGVQSTGDMTSGFNVRGGNSDQNLILIDDVPVYNPTHMFGMFSILDSRSIDNLELYKGGAPASLGGRASSIMDIELKEGDHKDFQGNGGVGIYNSRLTLQGPLVNEKVSFIVSGRTTYSDWILKQVPDVDIRNSRASFYDINAKVNYTINRKNRLGIFTYVSNDLFNLAGKTQYQYGNKLAAVKWSHISTEKLTYSLNVFFSSYQTKTTDNEDAYSASDFTAGIEQYGAKLRFLYSLNTKNRLEFGIEGSKYKFGRENLKPDGDKSNISAQSLEGEQSLEFAGYLQDVMQIGKKTSLSLGLRYSQYLYLGPKTVNVYEDGAYASSSTFVGSVYHSKGKVIDQYHGLEPRIGIRYNLSFTSSIKVAYSRTMQYMHILSNTSVVTPTDIWKSSDMYIKPAVGNQFVLGLFKNMQGSAYETSFEVYYKNIQNMLEYKNGAQLVLNPRIEQDVLASTLNAYGAEFLIKKNSGRLTGWVSYAYSRSFLFTTGAPKDELVNNGNKYPSYYDKPNDLSIVMNYKLSRRLTFGSTFTYSTGKPATWPESKYTIMGNDIVNYSDRNKYRLPDYNRLDVSLVWDVSLKKRKKYYSSWTFSVYNVYGRKNIYSTYYKKDYPSSANDYKPYSLYELSIIGIPIPSITYNFRF